jgi:hypothetical protein
MRAPILPNKPQPVTLVLGQLGLGKLGLELAHAYAYDPAVMPGEKDSLLRQGLAVLANLLPEGYAISPSGLNRRSSEVGEWIVVRNPKKRSVTCLVLARRRVESRDLGGIAASTARTPNPALLVSSYLAPVVRERLRGFGIGHWDLTGNVQIELGDIDLCVERDGTAAPGSGDRSARSLCGEMAGRVTRALIDFLPPYSLATLAEKANVETSCASRVTAYVAETGLLHRKPRGKIESVDWRELLRRWSLDTPLQARGEESHHHCPRGIPDFLSRLGSSGYLHALTGDIAFARLAGRDAPDAAVVYVDHVQETVAQFRLHPAGDAANIILVKPNDRSVFQRSTENAGLRYVSPSLMAADLGASDAFESVLLWMAKHESAWRLPSE